MKRVDYNSLEEVGSNNYLDYVGDFFQFPIVKLALTPLWNEYCDIENEEGNEEYKDELLEHYKDFTIENPKHLTFLRDIFEDDENLRVFFQNLRENSIESGNIEHIQQNYMSITQMILCMQDLVDRVLGPYGMSSFLDQRVRDIVEANMYKSVQVLDNFDGDQDTVMILGDYEKLLNLTAAGFSPITQYGDIAKSETAVPVYHVVHDAVIPGEEEGELIPVCIDKTGKVYEGVERIQAFITQYRCIIKNVENIQQVAAKGEVDTDYMQRVLYTFDIPGIFLEQDEPDFCSSILEALDPILADAKKQLHSFCEELGKTMKVLGENTKEYDLLKPYLLQQRQKDFPIVGARIKRVK